MRATDKTAGNKEPLFCTQLLIHLTDGLIPIWLVFTWRDDSNGETGSMALKIIPPLPLNPTQLV